MTDDLERRLREAVRDRSGNEPSLSALQRAALCWKTRSSRSVSRDEAADEIARLRAENERLRAGLRMAILGMTCRNGDAHYCPNCDNTTYEAREQVRTALQEGSRHE